MNSSAIAAPLFAAAMVGKAVASSPPATPIPPARAAKLSTKPLALAFNEGGEIQAPMGRAIIGGVITSTILTLVVVPVLYSYLVRDRRPVVAPAPAPVVGGSGLPPLAVADKD